MFIFSGDDLPRCSHDPTAKASGDRPSLEVQTEDCRPRLSEGEEGRHMMLRRAQPFSQRFQWSRF